MIRNLSRGMKSLKLGAVLAHCERGVSLVQVLMASTAIAGIALVGLRLAEEQKRVSMETYQTYLVEYYLQEVVYLLYRPQVCRATFAGRNPEQDRIEAIREPVSKDGDAYYLHFLSQEAADASGELYNGEVLVKNYRIAGDSDQANIKKKLTVLEIELLQGPDKKKIVKSIPFTFENDEEGAIKNCSARVVLGEGPAEGFWKEREGALVLNNLNVTLGDIGERGSGLSLQGRIRWQNASLEEACTSRIQGVLQFSPQGRLVYCKDGEWVSFGQNVYRWNEVTKYRYGIKQAGKNVEKTNPHRYCFITRQSMNTSSDQCLLSSGGEAERSEYEMIAQSGSNVTNLDCEVSCVD